MEGISMKTYFMNRLYLVTALVTGCALLSGCLVPEHFTAKVDIQPDAGYTFRYSGTALHAGAAMQLKDSGSLSANDEKGLLEEVKKMQRDPEVRRVSYKGKARYELEIESVKKPGQDLRMFDIFSVKTEKDGTMTISSVEIKDKDRHELDAMGLSIDGTLEVKLPKDVEVISSNASSKPTFGFGSYSWKIGRIDQRPLMKIKFKAGTLPITQQAEVKPAPVPAAEPATVAPTAVVHAKPPKAAVKSTEKGTSKSAASNKPVVEKPTPEKPTVRMINLND
jgi:hypothetical protein